MTRPSQPLLEPRVCSVCKEPKLLREFYGRVKYGSAAGLSSRCKTCDKKRRGALKSERRVTDEPRPVDGTVYSYDEIAAAIGVSCERVRQIERAALRKLLPRCRLARLEP